MNRRLEAPGCAPERRRAGGRRRFLAALALLGLVSCDARPPAPGDGPHEYASTPGRALVREVRVDGRDLLMTFDFRPDEASGAGACDGVQHRFAVSGSATDWAQDNGIATGREIRCIRMDRTRGTTSPLVWVFPDIRF